jgi:hypothetical protein
MIFFDIEYFKIVEYLYHLKEKQMMIIYRHINHEYCLVHLQKRTWIDGMFIRLCFQRVREREEESILLEVIVHIHYTSYILLFLLHNQCHHIEVSRGNTSIAKKSVWCDVPSWVQYQQCPLFIEWTVSSYIVHHQ